MFMFAEAHNSQVRQGNYTGLSCNFSTKTSRVSSYTESLHFLYPSQSDPTNLQTQPNETHTALHAECLTVAILRFQPITGLVISSCQTCEDGFSNRRWAFCASESADLAEARFIFTSRLGDCGNAITCGQCSSDLCASYRLRPCA